MAGRSRFGTYLGSGVTVRYDFGTARRKKEIYYARFVCIYIEQTVVQINIKILLDVQILIIDINNTIITLCYIIYEICFVFIVSEPK